MKITFNFPAHVSKDLEVIKSYAESKKKDTKVSFLDIIVGLIKEMREKIEYEKLNNTNHEQRTTTPAAN